MTKEQLQKKIATKKRIISGLKKGDAERNVHERKLSEFEASLKKLEGSDDAPSSKNPKSEDKPKIEDKPKPKPKAEDKPKPKPKTEDKPKPKDKKQSREEANADCSEVEAKYLKQLEKIRAKNKTLTKKLDTAKSNIDTAKSNTGSKGASTKGKASTKPRKKPSTKGDDMLIAKFFGVLKLVITKGKMREKTNIAEIKRVQKALSVSLAVSAKSLGYNESTITKSFNSKCKDEITKIENAIKAKKKA